jgi:hypothetical protein
VDEVTISSGTCTFRHRSSMGHATLSSILCAAVDDCFVVLLSERIMPHSNVTVPAGGEDGTCIWLDLAGSLARFGASSRSPLAQVKLGQR